ncbi:MAG: hypothetical protein WBP94_19150 [Rhodomicrobiaceae bacterium]
MKMKLQITKGDILLFEGFYDISDAYSFGEAFTDLWLRLREEQFNQESSIGALMEHLDSNLLDRLDGARIHLDKA